MNTAGHRKIDGEKNMAIAIANDVDDNGFVFIEHNDIHGAHTYTIVTHTQQIESIGHDTCIEHLLAGFLYVFSSRGG